MIKSAGWIIFIEKDNPKFLILKRQSLSKKIERTAPKWKIKENEDALTAALREIKEETNISPEYLINYWYLWEFEIHLEDENKKKFDKHITYYLFEYTWNKDNIKVANVEWYIWNYKWADITELLNMIYYSQLRNIFFLAYKKIKNLS